MLLNLYLNYAYVMHILFNLYCIVPVEVCAACNRSFILLELDITKVMNLSFKGVGGGQNKVSPIFFFFLELKVQSFLIPKWAHPSRNSKRLDFYGILKITSIRENYGENTRISMGNSEKRL